MRFVDFGDKLCEAFAALVPWKDLVAKITYLQKSGAHNNYKSRDSFPLRLFHVECQIYVYKRGYLGYGNDRLNVVLLDLQPMAQAGTPQEGAGAPLSLLGPLWAAPGQRRPLLGVPGLHPLVFDVPGQLPALPDLELNNEKIIILIILIIRRVPTHVCSFYNFRSTYNLMF